MEDQPLQQPLQQFKQPLVVYPSSSSYAPSSSSGSRGSFGTVFIVLAAILTLAALACLFGRLCNRGRKDHKDNNNKPSKHEKLSSKKSCEIRPVDREPRERGDDLEIGFGMNRPGPMTKPSGRNGGDIEFGFNNKRAGGGGGKKGPPPVIKHGVRFK